MLTHHHSQCGAKLSVPPIVIVISLLIDTKLLPKTTGFSGVFKYHTMCESPEYSHTHFQSSIHHGCCASTVRDAFTARRVRPRPDDQRLRGAHLRDVELCQLMHTLTHVTRLTHSHTGLQRQPARRRPLRSPHPGQHLHAHHEPHQRRVRAAHCRSRRRNRRSRHCQVCRPT